MAAAAASASAGVPASFTPPALPRPPTSTWALTTTRAAPALKASSAWARAWAADVATCHGGTGSPAAWSSALAWYSWSFMGPGQHTRAGAGAFALGWKAVPREPPAARISGGRGLLLRYRGREGMLAWAFHRISGLAIWLFVVIHVIDIYLAGDDPKAYDTILQVYASAPGRIGEVLLGAALLYHALNGLRIVIMDFWPRHDPLPPPDVVGLLGHLRGPRPAGRLHHPQAHLRAGMRRPR